MVGVCLKVYSFKYCSKSHNLFGFLRNYVAFCVLYISWSYLYLSPSLMGLHHDICCSSLVLNLWWNRWKVGKKNKERVCLGWTFWSRVRRSSMHHTQYPPLPQPRIRAYLGYFHVCVGYNVSISTFHHGKSIYWCLKNFSYRELWIIGRSNHCSDKSSCDWIVWKMALLCRDPAFWSRHQL